jgi:hypothetical protein
VPRSKVHQKRKLKQRRKRDKQEALIQKRVRAFNALPEEDQVALLTRWKRKIKEEEWPGGLQEEN